MKLIGVERTCLSSAQPPNTLFVRCLKDKKGSNSPQTQCIYLFLCDGLKDFGNILLKPHKLQTDKYLPKTVTF